MKNRPLCTVCLILSLLICGAVCIGKERAVKELAPSSLECCARDGDEIVFTGQIYKKEIKDDYQILYLKNNSIRNQKQFFTESRIIVYEEEKTETRIGQRVKVSGEVSFFQSARNPGNFDQKLYYQRQDIHGSVWAGKLKIIDSRPDVLADRLERFRQRWGKVFEKYMGREEASVLSAMILGEKSGVDAEISGLYRGVGIGHLLAQSGLHLSFIGIGIYQLLRRLTGSYPLGGASGILFLTLYILMAGFTVSVVRALVMFLFRVGADMAGRHYDAPTALSAAATVVLLRWPLSLYDGGFWLSFGAVFAILAVVPVVTDVLHGGPVQMTGNRKKEARSSLGQNREDRSLSWYLKSARGYVWQVILQGLAASVGINLVILPILLYYFFEFPLYSFILNLFVIPLMSGLLFLGMAGSLSALWFAPVSAVLFWICSRILWIYKMSCEITLRLPGARLVIGRPDLWQIVVYYVILFLGLVLLRYILLSVKKQEEQEKKSSQADWRNRGNQGKTNSRNGRKKQIVVFFLWAVGIMILTTRFGEEGKLTTVILDVGQGDGIFMRGPEGSTYLVDGGSSDVKKAGQYRLEPFLKSQGAGVLDYVFISHGDSDHMNGVEELIERQKIGVKIRTLVLPVQEVWDDALEGLARKAQKHGIRIVVIEPGQSLREGELAVTCIQPGNMGIEGDTGLEPGNAASMVLAVRYGKFDMLLTGDVEGEGEEQLARRLEEHYQNRTWDVLKVAHHGSKNSSTEEFLRQVHPAYAFISAGQKNRYGHPHKETIERLADIGCNIYSTQEKGAVIVKVEAGKTVRIKKY